MSVILAICVNTFAKQQTSGVDHIFDGLSKQNWNDDEISCRDQIFDILKSVKNSTLWATWVWNSIDQSPTGIFFGARYHLGAYDQCLRPLWLSTHPELRTQYCLAEIEMNKDGFKTLEPIGSATTDPYAKAEDYYLDTQTDFGRSFSYMAYGICLPAGCQTKSAEKFVKALVSTGYLHAAKEAPVSIHHCEEAGATHEYTTGFYIYIYTFTALVFIALTSTYYVSEFPTRANSDYFVNHIAKLFNIKDNWNILVKESTSDLAVLNGIRFLCAALVPFMHLLAIVNATSVSNGLDLELMRLHHLKKYLFHCDVITDTFLAMSGLLLGRNLSTLDMTKPYNLLQCILKRYLRFIGMLAVTVFYMAHVFMHTDDGPVYPKLALIEQQACEKNWWLTLLMLGNYFNVSEMCIPGTWQVCCDFQLFALTLILLYVYRKNPYVGKVVSTVVLVLGFLSPAITMYVYDLAAVPLYNVGLEINIRRNRFINFMYVCTHNRIGPYIAGLAVGYFMSIYKPEDYKKVWSKTKSLLGFCACLSIMVAVLVVGWLCFQHRINGPLAYVFVTFNRTTFTIGFLGVIVLYAYGDIPLVYSFLGWSVFGPLSKLSYGLYLIHQIIQFRCKLSLRTHMKNHFLDMFTESLGVVVVSLALSLCVWLLVEAPILNITTRYLHKTSTNVEGKTCTSHGDATNKHKAH